MFRLLSVHNSKCCFDERCPECLGCLLASSVLAGLHFTTDDRLNMKITTSLECMICKKMRTD